MAGTVRFRVRDHIQAPSFFIVLCCSFFACSSEQASKAPVGSGGFSAVGGGGSIGGARAGVMVASAGGIPAAGGAIGSAGGTPGFGGVANAQVGGAVAIGGGPGSSASSGGTGGAAQNFGFFVAVGDVGRSTISCDDGQSWVANRSDDDARRCWSQTNGDCDHDPGQARGLAFHAGQFVASFGWTNGGSTIRTSADGVNWTTVFTQADPSHLGTGGALFGRGVWLVPTAYGPLLATSPEGTWETLGAIQAGDVSLAHVRAAAFGGSAEGAFIVVGGVSGGGLVSGAEDVLVSTNPRTGWTRAATLSACTKSAYRNRSAKCTA
ncbi:MAG: hypothetical protein SFV15_16480 [Polyangiaceae bacterium]|nr:hypothetical protein [Polyangiaceae bacterium]